MSDLADIAYDRRHADVREVSVGALVIAQAPAMLVAPALGSCVAVALWDPVSKRGGLAHVMLPSPTDTAMKGHDERFASRAVGIMVDRLARLGVPAGRLVAKIAGGAAMFSGESRLAGIGERNAAEVVRQLEARKVSLEARDTGGSHARTVELHLETGEVVVRSYLYGVKRL